MAAAWNQIYPEHKVSKLPTTDIYVRFEPKNIEQFTAIHEAVSTFDAEANDPLDNAPTVYDYPWGFLMGAYLADQQYGVECDYSRKVSVYEDKQRARFIYRETLLGVYGVGELRKIETYNPNSSDLNNWIPIGLLWDLVDDDTHNNAPLFVSEPVTDNVIAVTSLDEIFQLICTISPTSWQGIKNDLKNKNPTVANDIEALFNEYGY